MAPLSLSAAPLSAMTPPLAAATPAEAADAASFLLALLPAAATPITASLSAKAPALTAEADEPLPAEPELSTLPEMLLALLGAPVTGPVAARANVSVALPANAPVSVPVETKVPSTSTMAEALPLNPNTPTIAVLPSTVKAGPATLPALTAEWTAASAELAPALNEQPPLQVLQEVLINTALPQHSAAETMPGFERFESWLIKNETLAPVREPVATTTTTVSIPPDHPGWADEVGQQVLWSARRGVQSAEIQLHPQELGSLNISLRVEQDQVSIQFSAAHASAREALEQSLPRLRELFAQQGLTLAQTQVFSQTSQDGARQQSGMKPGLNSGLNSSSASDAPTDTLQTTAPSQRLGLLDDYA